MSRPGGGPRNGPGGGPAAAMTGGEKANNFKGTMIKLLIYLKPYRLRLALVFLFVISSTLFTIVSPTILGEATDVIVAGLMRIRFGLPPETDFEKLLGILLFLLGLYGISFVFSFAQGFMMSKISMEVVYRLRKNLSEKMDRLPIKYFDGTTHGDIQSRFINDIETISQTLSQSLTQTLTGAATLLGILIMMARINAFMTLVALLALPLSMLLIRLVVGRSQKHFRTQQNTLAKVNGHVEEMYTGHTLVKVFHREAKSIETFDAINEELYQSAWKSQFFSGLMMPLTLFIGNLSYVAICILGGYLALHGKVSIGNIQAFIQYVRSFQHPIAQVASVFNLLQSTAAAAERVFAFLEEEEEADPWRDTRRACEKAEAAGRTGRKAFSDIPLSAPVKGNKEAPLRPEDCKGEVAFNHISFGYKGGEPVIHDFHYTAAPGSRVAIVGPTGAGKTTIVKLLMRYYELNAGQIRIDGHDIRDFSRADLRALFGMVLQDAWLFSGTARDNIRYGKPTATDAEVEAAAGATYLHHHILTQPKGYDMEINEEASNLSQGQKQLLTIARALLADKPILILDEATSSVDTRTEQKIQQAMSTLMEGRTSFIIAHRLSTIKDADWILVMEHGDIVEQGTHRSLLAKKGHYAKMYMGQFA